MPPRVEVIQAGIALSRSREFGQVAVSCGIAGGLRADLPTGTVLIPHSVRRPGGSTLTCDAQLTEALVASARRLGYEPVSDPLLTSTELVSGAARAHWSAQGFAGVDMETGLIRAERVGCVRVILDTPRREISASWQNPGSVVFHPRAWLDLPFLAREGPRCARIAARIAAGAVSSFCG